MVVTLNNTHEGVCIRVGVCVQVCMLFGPSSRRWWAGGGGGGGGISTMEPQESADD